MSPSPIPSKQKSVGRRSCAVHTTVGRRRADARLRSLADGRIELGRLFEIRLGLVLLAEFLVGFTAEKPGKRVLRVLLDGSAEVLDRLLVLALLVENDAALPVAEEVLRGEFDRLRAIGDG